MSPSKPHKRLCGRSSGGQICALVGHDHLYGDLLLTSHRIREWSSRRSSSVRAFNKRSATPRRGGSCPATTSHVCQHPPLFRHNFRRRELSSPSYTATEPLYNNLEGFLIRDKALLQHLFSEPRRWPNVVVQHSHDEARRLETRQPNPSLDYPLLPLLFRQSVIMAVSLAPLWRRPRGNVTTSR